MVPKLNKIFQCLAGGQLLEIHRDGDRLGLKVRHPALAARFSPGSRDFHISLIGFRQLKLQPVAQSSALLHKPLEILSLDVILLAPIPSPNPPLRVKVGIGGEARPLGRLHISADSGRLFNSEFDELDPDQVLNFLSTDLLN